jgi:hypothetical protein
MVEASVLVFKREVTTVNQLIRIYGQARGEIVASFKAVLDVFDYSRGSEKSRTCTRTTKEYRIDNPSEFTVNRQFRDTVSIERVLGIDVKWLRFRVLGTDLTTQSSMAGISSVSQ